MKDKNRLIELLDKAEYLAKQFSGGYSGHFLSTEEFHKSLVDSIAKLKSGDLSQLDKLYLWFLPTSCWDDFIGSDGQDLGKTIFELVTKIKNKQI